jgi:hypothetical protein
MDIFCDSPNSHSHKVNTILPLNSYSELLLLKNMVLKWQVRLHFVSMLLCAVIYVHNGIK